MVPLISLRMVHWQLSYFLWRVNDYINIIFIEGISLMTFAPPSKKNRTKSSWHERQTTANDCCDWMKGVNLPTKSLHGSSCDLNEREICFERALPRWPLSPSHARRLLASNKIGSFGPNRRDKQNRNCAVLRSEKEKKRWEPDKRTVTLW